jgi:hypothetical protein
MSKGLGHVGRAVLAAFEDEPDNAFTTEELCERVYGRNPSRAGRVAVLRAVKGLAARRPDLGVASWAAETRGGQTVFFRERHVMSYAMARLKSEGRWFGWHTEAQLRAMLAPGGFYHHCIQPGGAWVRFTAMAIAKRDGDHAALKRLEAEQERVMNALTESVQTALTSVNR